MLSARLAAESLRREGFVLIGSRDMESMLPSKAVHGFSDIAGSWDRLVEDRFTSDGGGYRRRRHAYGPSPAQERHFCLMEPLDTVLIDDSRVLHEVTPITPLDPSASAHRDVFVATFTAQ